MDAPSRDGDQDRKVSDGAPGPQVNELRIQQVSLRMRSEDADGGYGLGEGPACTVGVAEQGLADAGPRARPLLGGTPEPRA